MEQIHMHDDNNRGLIGEATALLARCGTVTLASVNADGFPRPVPMGKGQTAGCHEIWMATGASSEKVADFTRDARAGLCYADGGDSVCLRGRVEIVRDDAVRRAMWQESYAEHFPGGPTDPEYVLLRFVGTEATFWIDGAFVHERLTAETTEERNENN